MEKVYHFCIADLGVNIVFQGDTGNSLRLAPSFMPFLVEEEKSPLLFTLVVDDSLKPCRKAQREHIRDIDTGNGITAVDRLANGGYQYIIRNVEGYDCCLLITNEDFTDCRCALNGNYNMRCFGLNNALMLAFAFAGCQRQCLLVHASLVRQDGYGYAFVAKSGTGKSTQVSMWLRNLPNCDLMNDDNPIIRVIGGKPYIYGSPWSGKTPCYRSTKAPLGAVTSIVRSKTNHVDKLGVVQAFAALLPACSSMKWDKKSYDYICDTITHVIETTGIYELHCLPNPEAAILCNKTIKIK